MYESARAAADSVSASLFASGLDRSYPLTPCGENRHQFRAKIQEVGGHCEVSIKSVNVAALAELDRDRWIHEGIGRRAKWRNPSVPRDPEDLVRASRRARQMLRLRATELGVDRLFTLTSRGHLLTRDSAQKAWSRFALLAKRVYPTFEYIAVPETHKSGAHWHIHFATAGFLNVNVLRRLWHAVLRRQCSLPGGATGAESPGNIDVSYTGRSGGVKRCRKIAGYLAKYLTKQAHLEFGRKSYWPSKGIALRPPRYVWCAAGTVHGAVEEVCRLLGHWDAVAPAFEVWSPSGGFAWYWADPDRMPAPPF
jgi:hypothetical protein